MQRGRDTPQQHTAGHPCDHAILPSQGSTDGLQGDEEGEEEGYGGIQVGAAQANVCCEVCGFSIAYLLIDCQQISSTAGWRSAYIGLVETVEQEE